MGNFRRAPEARRRAGRARLQRMDVPWRSAGRRCRRARACLSGYRPLSQQLAIVPTVSVVIPAKNEARNLPIVLGSLPDWVDEVVLVDGHSVDETIAVAQQCRPDIKVVTQPGKGKGDALLAGFKACTSDIVVMMDGDGSTPGTEIVRFVAALVAGADFAKGSRFANSGGSDDITVGRRLGNRILSGLVNLTFGTRYTDLCYGYNAFWSEHLPDLYLDCGGFEIETVMNIRAAKAALRVQEVPSRERPQGARQEQSARGRSTAGASSRRSRPRHHPGLTRSPPRRTTTRRRWWRRWLRRKPFSAPGQRSTVDDGAADRTCVGPTWTARPSRSRRRPNSRTCRHPPQPARRTVDPSRGMVSVVICAYTEQRWDDTLAAVESVRDQSFANREIILVIDHNPALYASFTCVPARHHRDRESRRAGAIGREEHRARSGQGRCRCLSRRRRRRRTGLAQILRPFVRRSIRRRGRRSHPAVVGGAASSMVPEGIRLGGRLHATAACPRSRGPVRNLLGGNASFRRDTLKRVGGFQNGIGRSERTAAPRL